MKLNLQVNPVLAREFRSRMRGWRSPLTITLYVGALGGIGFAFFKLMTRQMYYGGMPGPQIGLQIYNMLALFQLMLIVFTTPGLTSGSISGERERQTFDLMLVTRLSPTSVVLGKVVSSISYNLLLIMATLPLFSIVFLFGGISPKQFALTFAVYGVTALLMGTLGIFCSTIFRRTQVATVVSYAVALFLLFGTSIVGLFWNEITMNPGPQYKPRYGPPFITYFNPLSALISAISTNPYGGFYIPYLPIPMPGYYYGPPPPGVKAPWPAWQYNFIISGIAIVVLLLLTIWLVKPVKRVWIPGLGFLRRRRNAAMVKRNASEAAKEIAAEKESPS